MILKDEWPAIQTAFQEPYFKFGLVWPKCLLTTSLKPHATWFFPVDGGERDRNGNPRCGPVVDRKVTYERGYDFYLQSHDCIQGTARRAHYVVLVDEIGLPAEVVQQEVCHQRSSLIMEPY